MIYKLSTRFEGNMLLAWPVNKYESQISMMNCRTIGDKRMELAILGNKATGFRMTLREMKNIA